MTLILGWVKPKFNILILKKKSIFFKMKWIVINYISSPISIFFFIKKSSSKWNYFFFKKKKSSWKWNYQKNVVSKMCVKELIQFPSLSYVSKFPFFLISFSILKICTHKENSMRPREQSLMCSFFFFFNSLFGRKVKRDAF